MENLDELINKIKNVEENQAIQLQQNILLWKEGSKYDLKVSSKQFDQLHKLVEQQKGDIYYFIDLSLAKRPTPEIVDLIEKRLRPIKHKFKHVGVYTGQNYIIYIGIKFYFIKFDFPSYSAHTSIKGALNSLLNGSK